MEISLVVICKYILDDIVYLGMMPRIVALNYGDKYFAKIMWLKVTSVYIALAAGFDVIFQDADLVWIKDPVPMLHSFKGYDMIFMELSPWSYFL
jgi:hypothetical protein